MHLASLTKTRKINIVLSTVIILLIAGIMTVFIRHRALIKNTGSPSPPESTGASVVIKNFHHVATENGVIQWTLEAGSARMYSDENTVSLDQLSAIFFSSDNQTLTLKANKGLLNSETNDMTISGDIVAKTSGYRLSTESLNYIRQLHMIQINEPVDIAGPLMALSADTMTYDINTQTIKCEGNIKGSFTEYDENTPEE